MFNFSQYNYEYNECVARGICSTLPGISALMEVFFVVIRQIAYYLLKLKMIGEDTSKEDKILINLLSVAIKNTYSDEQILSLVNSAYTNLQKIRYTYIKKCKEFSIEKSDVSRLINLDSDMNLKDIINFGEIVFHERYRLYSSEEKSYMELLNIIIKSTSDNLIHLLDYEFPNEKFILEILEALNLMNRKKVSLNKYRSFISNLVNIDNEISNIIYDLRIKHFGSIKKVSVSYSTDKGKAILVSGSGLEDLKTLLEYLKDTDIDVYTHDDLLSAHVYEYFRNYKNLKGHFGICQENCILDFAIFPGAIFLTKNSKVHTDYLYRGRLFTMSEIVPKGAQKIGKKDFHSLVESAINSKGFAKGQTRPQDIVGFDKVELREIFEDLSKNLKENIIEKILVVYPNSVPSKNLEEIILRRDDKTYILNLSHEELDVKNYSKINVANSRYLLSKVMKLFFEYVSYDNTKINFYIQNCEPSSISNIIYLSEKGFKNISILNCSPNSIRPTLKDFILKKYGNS